jgi:outer membrane protein OmpA-like peptidoglycan-associated protein
MKLKSALLAGAVIPFMAAPNLALATETHAGIVVAQQQPANADKDKERHKRPAAKPNAPSARPAHPPGNQQNGRAGKPTQQRATPQREAPAGGKAQNNRQPAPAPQRTRPAAQRQAPAQTRPNRGESGRPAAQTTPPASRSERPRQPATAPAPSRQPTVQQAPAAAPQRKPAATQTAPSAQPPAARQQPTTPDQRNVRGRENARQPQNANAPQQPRRIESVRGERKETREGNRTVIRENTRTIVKEGNRTIIRHDDAERFRRGGGNAHVERRGGNRVVTVERPGGVRIVDVIDEQGRLVRRSRWRGGHETVLINNRYGPRQSGFSFIVNLPPPVVRIPRDHYIVEADRADRALLYQTLIAPPVERIEHPYTLEEIRYSPTLRERMPRIDLDTVTFDTGSWELAPDQVRLLEPIAMAMQEAIDRNPDEIFLIEGHTDAVGSEIDNLSLSDRRAETVAEVLTESFGIPPENLTTQGYGEQDLKIPVQGPERRNRRVTIRRITPLLAGPG